MTIVIIINYNSYNCCCNVVFMELLDINRMNIIAIMITTVTMDDLISAVVSAHSYAIAADTCNMISPWLCFGLRCRAAYFRTFTVQGWI